MCIRDSSYLDIDRSYVQIYQYGYLFRKVNELIPVSYTHLDVYKRQPLLPLISCDSNRFILTGESCSSLQLVQTRRNVYSAGASSTSFGNNLRIFSDNVAVAVIYNILA